MALLPDPTTAASERSSVKNRLTRSRRRGSGIKKQAQVQNSQQNEFKRAEAGSRRMQVQRVQGQGCPQHESTQPRPLTLLPHKMRVRRKKQAQVQTVSKTSLRGVESLGVGGVQRVQGRGVQGGPEGAGVSTASSVMSSLFLL